VAEILRNDRPESFGTRGRDSPESVADFTGIRNVTISAENIEYIPLKTEDFIRHFSAMRVNYCMNLLMYSKKRKKRTFLFECQLILGTPKIVTKTSQGGKL
jgi:hypothetical protein